MGSIRLGGPATAAVVLLSALSAAAFAEEPVDGRPAARPRTLRLPQPPHRYADPAFPPHFGDGGLRTLDNTPADNPTTDAGAALGRALFYDVRLSANGTVSCGTCHRQSNAFADPGAVSIGYKGRAGDRNAMSLVNLRFSRAGFFWDERVATLEDAVLTPVHSKLEMGHDSASLVRAVAADPGYRPLFQKAFGDEDITEKRIGRALAQFVRSLVSFRSKYDAGAAATSSVKDDFPNFTAAENLGKSLFLKRCHICHHIGEGPRLAFFSSFRSLNNGIDADGDARDGGRGEVSLNPAEVGLFKPSSLRNVEVTAPYMHDGRFATLEEVVEHYSSGVRRHPTLGPAARFNFSAAEKAAVVAFLRTLTDREFLSDPRFSDPWEGGAPAPRAAPAPNRPPAGARPSAAERIAAGRGLEPGEALPWLSALDADGDGFLSRAECAEAARVLVRTGVRDIRSRMPAEDAAPPRLGDGAAPGQPKAGPAGDFDGDGSVDPHEAREYAAFRRLVELGDGGRMEVRLDRFLGRFRLTPDQAVEARSALRAVKAGLRQDVLAADAAVLGRLRSLLTAEQFARFQERVIAGRFRDGRGRPAAAVTENDALRQLFESDADGDGRLGREEIAALAAVLDALPGGFGQAPAVAPDMAGFSRRIVGYGNGDGSVPADRLPERMHDLIVHGDADRDGVLSPAEIEAHIRRTAFARLADEGVYIGGGFGDLFVEAAPAIADLGLPAGVRSAAEAVLRAHAERIEAVRIRAGDEAFPRFRDAVRRR